MQLEEYYQVGSIMLRNQGFEDKTKCKSLWQQNYTTGKDVLKENSKENQRDNN